MKTLHLKLLLAIAMTCSSFTNQAQEVISKIEKSSTSTTIVLSNDTNNEDLASAIEEFKKEGVLISFKNVQRNEAGQITGIGIHANSKKGNLTVSFSKSSPIPIDPIEIAYNSNPSLTIKTVGVSQISKTLRTQENHTTSSTFTTDNQHENSSASTKVEKKVVLKIEEDKDSDEHKSNKQKGKNNHKIFINNNPNAETTIIVNGKVVSEEELNKMDSDDIITIEVRSVRKPKKLITQEISTPTKPKKNAPLYILDGKEVSTIDHIHPDGIKTIIVLKGEKAINKYGPKAINGAVEVSTR